MHVSKHHSWICSEILSPVTYNQLPNSSFNMDQSQPRKEKPVPFIPFSACTAPKAVYKITMPNLYFACLVLILGNTHMPNKLHLHYKECSLGYPTSLKRKTLSLFNNL